MRATAISLAATFALVSALTASAATQPNVHGVLVRPVASVGCYPDEPCDPPAFGALLVFTRGGRVVTSVRVGAGGQFALHLAPGLYAVRAAPALLVGAVTPATFRVPRAGAVSLRLQAGRGATAPPVPSAPAGA